METWKIKKELNVSQIITIIGLLITFILGFAKLQATVDDNAQEIVTLKKITADLENEQRTRSLQYHDIQECQKRQLKYIELIAKKLNIDYVE